MKLRPRVEVVEIVDLHALDVEREFPGVLAAHQPTRAGLFIDMYDPSDPHFFRSSSSSPGRGT
jgi:hypothetical protein